MTHISRCSFNPTEGGGMPYREIKNSIGELKQELEQTPRETSRFEALLENAREGIDRYTPEALQELVHTLQHEAEALEVDHPRITALINQIMISLSNLGI